MGDGIREGHIRLMIERFSAVLEHSPKEGVTVDTIALQLP